MTIDLRLGDCLELMREIPDASIDLIATDPAYESMKRWEGIGTTARMGMGKKGSGSDDLEGKFFDCIANADLPDFVQECHRVLKDERHCYIMADWETLKLLHTFAIAEGVFQPVGYGGLFEPCKPIIWDTQIDPKESAESVHGLIRDWLHEYVSNIICNEIPFQDIDFTRDSAWLMNWIGGATDPLESQAIVWDKVASGMGYTYRATYEFVFMLWKGKKRKLNDLGVSDVLHFKKPWGKERIFPTQKPVELFELLISQSTQPNEVVLDPFLGSGTTAIAAMKTGRRFIGIEKSQQNLELAQRRIAEAQAQMTMALT